MGSLAGTGLLLRTRFLRAAFAPWEDLSRLSRIRTNHAKTQVWARSVHSFVSLENAGFSPSLSVEIRDVPIGLCGRSAGCDGRKCSDKCRRFGFRLAALQCSHSFKSNLAEEEHEEPVTIILDLGADAPAFPATWASAGVKAKKEHWEETTRQGNPNTWTKRCGGPFEGKTLFLDLITFLLDLDTFTGPYYNSFGDGYSSFGPAHPPAGPHPSLLLDLALSQTIPFSVDSTVSVQPSASQFFRQ